MDCNALGRDLFLAFNKKKIKRNNDCLLFSVYCCSETSAKFCSNIFKYLQYFIKNRAKLIFGAILLKFWSMTKAKHISKCVSSGGNPGSSVELLSWSKLNMCLLSCKVYLNAQHLWPDRQMKLIGGQPLRDFEPAHE